MACGACVVIAYSQADGDSDPAGSRLGVVLGSGSLAWQMAVHTLTGGRVKVHLRIGAMQPGGAVALHEPESLPKNWASRLAEQGFTRPVVAVRVTAVGRMPVTVQAWKLRAPQGVELSPIADSIGPALPHRLDHGESETWAAGMAMVAAFVETVRDTFEDTGIGGGPDSPRDAVREGYRHGRGQPPGLVAVVELGDGREKRSREVLPL